MEIFKHRITGDVKTLCFYRDHSGVIVFDVLTGKDYHYIDLKEFHAYWERI